MITLASALMRIASAPTIVALDAGAQGCSYLAWGEHLERIPWQAGADLAAWLNALSPRQAPPAPAPDAPAHLTAPAPGSSAPALGTAGWSGFHGGVFLQLDYESPATPPRAWKALGWVSWSHQAGMRLHGDDLHCARMRAELAGAEQRCAAPRLLETPQPALTRSEHQRLVEHIRDQIGRGTLYQVNLTLPFRARHAGEANGDLGAFLALCALSPAPFAAFIRGPGRPSLISHSPECLLRGRDAELTACPIKGTRRRIPGREAEIRSELMDSHKDRAELTMIVDLTRNDLGRVAVPGSVVVAEPAQVIDLSYAHHLVGTVSARLADGLGYGDAIHHAFPAGSITGAPKRQAMTMLASLEGRPRGAYCGCFGWIGADGCELAVAIRTLVIDEASVQVHAGGGIVADSDPASEWDEVQVKAATMLRALERA